MTHQPDMLLDQLTDPAVLDRIDAQLPKQREVKAPRLPEVLHVKHSEVETIEEERS